MDIDTLIDELLDRCWRKISSGSKGSEFIYASQFNDLMEEIQTSISSGSLLNESEIKFLKEMINNKPLLKLYKTELTTFILKMVGYPNLVKFFSERAGVSPFNLKLILSNPSNSSRPNSRTNRPTSKSPKHLDYTENTSTPIIEKYKSRRMEKYSNNLNPFENGIQSKTNLLLKEKQINQRDEEIMIITKENKHLKSELIDKSTMIKDLQNQFNELKSYIDSLESKLNNKNEFNSNSDRIIIKDLVQRCNDRDKTIKHLENIVEDYERNHELNKTNPIIHKLTSSIKTQQELINQLSTKLKLQETTTETSTDITKLIINIPFLKQFYMYYNYKNQNKNFGILFINVITLLLTSVIIMTGLRILFLIILYLFSGSSGLHYIYDDYSYDIDKISINWWQEIDSIEYIMYNINDWLDGYFTN